MNDDLILKMSLESHDQRKRRADMIKQVLDEQRIIGTIDDDKYFGCIEELNACLLKSYRIGT